MQFVEATENLARSVVAFHGRFGAEPVPLSARLTLLMEEVGEHARAINRNESGALEEMADVVYIALGTLELAGEEGTAALQQVALKNNRKTPDLYEFRAGTDGIGKVLRR